MKNKKIGGRRGAGAGGQNKHKHMVRKIRKGDPLWGAGGWGGGHVRGPLGGREGRGWG